MARFGIPLLLLLLGSLVLQPAEAESQPPGIMFSTLLNNVQLHEGTGKFSLGNQMQAVFLPSGAKGHVILRKADGAGVSRYDWEEDPLKPPYALFGFLSLRTDLATGKTTQQHLQMTAPGDYALDFLLGDRKFYTFPFQVQVVSPTDPFSGGDLYFLNGAWNDWGYLYYRDADPTANLAWKIWLRHQDPAKIHQDVKIRVEVTRDGDGKVLCQSREGTTWSLSHDWIRYEFDMVNPPVKTSGGAYFKAGDLLARNGKYTLKMTVDGKSYGTWRFEVAGGMLQYAGPTVRGSADPLTFVEGGRDAWWYRRQ